MVGSSVVVTLELVESVVVGTEDTVLHGPSDVAFLLVTDGLTMLDSVELVTVPGVDVLEEGTLPEPAVVLLGSVEFATVPVVEVSMLELPAELAVVVLGVEELADGVDTD